MKFYHILLISVITSLLVTGFTELETYITSNYNACPYEGAECPNAQHYMKDYQLDIHSDTTAVLLYDADRLVGKMPYSGNPLLDSLLSEDNR